MKGIIAKKVGMTKIFNDSGSQVPCTIIEIAPCFVSQIKTIATDGYEAVQISVGDKKEKNATKSEVGHFSKAGITPKKEVKEFRGFSLGKKLGEQINCEIFSEDDIVEVVGFTKGKGFQGVVKRHGFSGVGEASHGQHDRSRAPGSIGASSYPSKVFKGMKMAGRTGGERQTVKGLRVLKIYPKKNYILLKGAVPGSNNSTIYIQSN